MKLHTLKHHLPRICYLESCGNYTYVHFTDSPRVLYARTLSYSLSQIPGLIRVHRQYAINPHLAQAVQVDKKAAWVLVADQKLPISRRSCRSVVGTLTNQGLVLGKQ